MPSADAPTVTSSVYTVVRSELGPSGETAAAVEAIVTAPFVVNTNLWDTAGLPVPVTYDSRGEVAGNHDVQGLITRAIDAWNTVTPGTFQFSYNGLAAGDAGGCASVIHLDGINTIKFAPLGGKLGLTCTVFLGTGPTKKLVEFDMQLSDDASLWASSATTPVEKFDLPSTILHELGHAAGLGHAATGTVMDGTLYPGTQRRTPTADDKAGLLSAYPGVATATVAANLKAQGNLFKLRAAFVAQD